MEGEEPFESRLDTDVGMGALSSQAALSDSDFPTLGASSPQQQQQQRYTSSQPRNSAKDILLAGSSGVQPSTAGTGWGRSSDASAATVKQFWDQRPPGWPAEGGPHRLQASGARASVPTVETGDKLKQLYEQARAEAKDHALKRVTCFRQVKSSQTGLIAVPVTCIQTQLAAESCFPSLFAAGMNDDCLCPSFVCRLQQHTSMETGTWRGACLPGHSSMGRTWQRQTPRQRSTSSGREIPAQPSQAPHVSTTAAAALACATPYPQP